MAKSMSSCLKVNPPVSLCGCEVEVAAISKKVGYLEVRSGFASKTSSWPAFRSWSPDFPVQ